MHAYAVFVAKYLANGAVSWATVMGNAVANTSPPGANVVSIDASGNVVFTV